MMSRWKQWGFRCILAVLAALMLLASPPPAAAADALTAEQKAAVEETVRAYILSHPEVIVESLTAYQAQQNQAQREAAEAAVATAGNELERDPTSPVAGNPDGDVTLVEFFDYRCGYCKRVLPSVQKLLKDDGNIRLVLKEYPILGPDSLTAAKASLAVWQTDPDKYMDVHAALLNTKGALDEERVLDLIAAEGVDRDTIRKAMAEPGIEDVLRANFDLGQRLGVNGTPAFIIGDRAVPGAIDLEQMEKLVADARGD